MTATRLPDSLWLQLQNAGRSRGSESPAVVVVEFMDFECPYCKAFHAVVLSLLMKRQDLAVRLVHFPLPRHRLAQHAAQAAECAGQQGAFDAYADILFSSQDSIGIKTFEQLAARAGVRDARAFGTCLAAPSSSPEIGAGVELGNRIVVTATPTIIINGWRLSRPPSGAELPDIIERLVAGKAPIE